MTRDDVMALLAGAVPDLTEVADGATGRLCTIAPIATSRAGAQVHLSERWISVETALHGDAPPDSRGALRLQSALPAVVKVVRRQGHLCLRAEIPILVETAAARDWTRRQTARAYAGLCIAQQHEGTAPAEDDGAEFDASLFAERCTAGGWCTTVVRDAEVHVELASRSVHRVVTVSPHGGAIRMAVALEAGALPRQDPALQSAVAAFLVRATRSLRWVRAFGAESGACLASVGFECLLAPPGDDQPIVTALDAIATACELFGCEAETLAESPRLAQQYLAWDRDPCAPKPNDPADCVSPRAVPIPGAAEVAVA